MVTRLDYHKKALRKQRDNLIGPMEDILSLYKLTEAFPASEDVRNELKLMMESTTKIMQSPTSFLWFAPTKDDQSAIITQNIKAESIEEFQCYLTKTLASSDSAGSLNPLSYHEVEYILAPVKSSSRMYGYLGIEGASFPHLKLHTFLAELIAMGLEKYNHDQFSSKLIIMEERNRIANEIHDGVSQRLFSILCGIHALKTNWSNMDRESIGTKLGLIEQYTKNLSTELRATIYDLSTTKKGERIFEDSIRGYLSDFAQLNNIQARLYFSGDEERLSTNLKGAMYRIVREAVGNAVRHGKSSQVEVIAALKNSMAELIIKDNGQGFDVTRTLKDKSRRGLGINNIQVLVETHNGIIEITSELGIGTILKIKVPLSEVGGRLAERKVEVA